MSEIIDKICQILEHFKNKRNQYIKIKSEAMQFQFRLNRKSNRNITRCERPDKSRCPYLWRQ